MAKSTRKTTTKKTTRRKPASAKAPTKSTKKRTSTSTAKKTSRAGSTTRTQKAAAKKKKTAGETEVTVDRRRSDRRTGTKPVATERRKLERREKVTRRRQIDPTTCERDYSDDEVEFMNALDNYKRTSGRMFPTCSEILEVIRKLGYIKQPAARSGSDESSALADAQISSASPSIMSEEDMDDEMTEEVFAGEELLV